MRIDNNYTQYRQPNFGRLKSIKYCNSNYLDLYPQETAELLRAVKESKAFNEFFEKYDVDMLLDMGEYSISKKKYADLTLKTRVPKPEGNNWYPRIIFEAKEEDKGIYYKWELINILTRKIKEVEFSNLKYDLKHSLEKLTQEEQNDKLNKKARAQIDDITNSLLRQDSHSPVESKEKTLFEKLFGWLK